MAVKEKFLNFTGLSVYDGKIKVYASDKATDAKTAAINASQLTVDTSTTTEGYAKSYNIKQNGTSIAIIDIPKDMVVSSGSVVTNPEGQAEGTYLELTLANAAQDKIYINVGTLVDIYKAKANASQIQIAIDAATREISATIVAGSIGTDELADKAVTSAKIADGAIGKTQVDATVLASLNKADGAIQDITTGGADGTIEVDGVEVPVAGLGSAAYEDTDAFDIAGTAENKVNALANGAVANNSTEIETLKTKVSSLEAGAVEAITVAEIESLFVQAAE